jgi:hypothetical protein
LPVVGSREETFWDEIVRLRKEIFAAVDSVVVYPNRVVFGGVGYTIMIDDREFAVASTGSTRWRVKSESFCETSVEWHQTYRNNGLEYL